MANDTFGLKREKIILRSRVRDIFTPHSPVQSEDFLAGRQREVSRLLEHINTPGQHALLFGDRGVGKTSIGIVTSLIYVHLLENKGTLLLKRCDSQDNFLSIIAAPLSACGYDIDVTESEKSHIEENESQTKISVLSEKVRNAKKKKETIKGISSRAASPSWVAEKLAKTKALFIVDEADAIREDSDRHKLAELIKQLSDLRSEFKILVIGIAATGESLTAGHPSVQRCLKETYLKKMDNIELREIITKGAKELRLVFDYDVVNKIIDLSSGYPHFTHLIALKCAEDAIVESRTNIKMSHLKSALRNASADAEETLKRSYEIATRSEKEISSKIITAATFCSCPDFNLKDIRFKYSELTQTDINTKNFYRYFQKLVADDRTRIFCRVAKGAYRFSDPRMSSYVRITDNNI